MSHILILLLPPHRLVVFLVALLLCTSGIVDSGDLDVADDELLKTLGSFLKPVATKRFLKYFGI
jgi:hypothetical protein